MRDKLEIKNRKSGFLSQKKLNFFVIYYYISAVFVLFYHLGQGDDGLLSNE